VKNVWYSPFEHSENYTTVKNLHKAKKGIDMFALSGQRTISPFDNDKPERFFIFLRAFSLNKKKRYIIILLKR